MKRQIRDRGLSNGYLPRNLFRLRKAALSRGTNLAILPQFYSKRRESTCYLDYKDHKIFWRLEWAFPHSINPITLYDERVDEETLLANCLDKYLLPQSTDTFQGQLDYYRSYGHAGVSVVVKDEGCPANVQKYILLKQYKSLKENFRKLTIIEYPKLIVVPNIHLYNYLG
ncbi:hypothetical protein CEXT_619651 [Caerostris extrusa]|uniref:BCD1 alpha/beta domain-containing protein n=1 Tax=Caerostris extrusa TaxID=172846 RepID=A0AAV4W8I9_CAEEX|nr:hypothetical protein CEXT_619651 [Caerostris extrusa]